MKIKTAGSKQTKTETKIKRALTRLQKLVHQYYEENPGVTNSMANDKDEINYYGSALVGISYNEYTDKWQTIANITLHGVGENYFEIRSPIDHRPVK